jgi:DNA-binding SARP family transcriptional activator
LFEFRATQLRFTPEETAEWLQLHDLSLPDDVTARLIEKTEGWGAGLQLAITLFQERQSHNEIISQLSGSQPYIFDYLMEEVFARQSASVQEFLLRSSIFYELNHEVCAEALDISAAPELLETVERNHLFIFRLSDSVPRYRYHELFRDFLSSKLKTQSPQEYNQLNGVAGAYFARREQYESAARHYIQIADWDQTAEMLCKFADDFLTRGRFDELHSYLQLLSVQIKQRKPELLLLEGRILRYRGHLNAALMQLRETLTYASEKRIIWSVHLEQAAIYHSQGQYQQAYEFAQQALLLIDEHDSCSYVPALMQMAHCAGFIQGMDYGRQLAEDAFHIMQAHLHVFSTYEQANLLQALGQICWWHGDVRMAVYYCQSGLSRIDSEKTPLKARLMITLATPTLYQQDYATALDLAQQAIAICQEFDVRETLPAAYAVLGNILTRMGKLDNAESALRTAMSIAQEIGGARYPQVMAAGYLAQNLALQGRLGEAHQIAKMALIPYEHERVVYDVYVCQSVLADLMLERNELIDARAIFETLIKIGEQLQYRIPLAMAYFGMAYILMREEQHLNALRFSQMSLELLEPAMMRQLYLDQRERALLICERLRLQNPDNAFVSQVYGMLLDSAPALPTTIRLEDTSRRIKVHTLGAFRIIRDGEEINPGVFAAATARDLLAYFITNRHKSIHLERIINDLWEDGNGSTSGFHTALYRVRGALRRDDEKEKFILSTIGEYRLDSARFEIDVDQFDKLIKRAANDPQDNRTELYKQAIDLYQGEYLDNLYYEWLVIERERLQRQYIEIVQQYCQRLIDQQQYDVARMTLRRAFEYEPYQENLHSLYMITLLNTGDHHEVIRHYEALCALLQDVFGADPLPETQDQYHRLIAAK